MSFACELPIKGPAADRAAAMAVQIPVLETERLRLRAPVLTDFPAYAEIACSPRGAYLGVSSRKDAWYDFANTVAGWLLRGHGLWSVETLDGILLGFVVIGFEPGDEEPELGFVMTEAGEGHGYAAEAARAARDFAFGTLKLPSLVSYIDADNARSIALAKRLGAYQDGVIREAGEPEACIFRHPLPGEV
ncbi:MAG: GNAT family N-acetyltransferase [Ruegeria sp.]|uniref:GNAT family N-acetyltransferase n=1 Tax=Ruegeria sp. TaxID=1879320 RepID=UPI00349E7CB6